MKPAGLTHFPAPFRMIAVMCCALMLLNGCSEKPPEVPAGADPEQGRVLIKYAGCGSCHRIPGIDSANGEVGPPLDGIAQRAYLAGVLPNHFDNMVLWIAQPQAVAPESAMPNLGLTESEAIHIAAYLYTLK